MFFSWIILNHCCFQYFACGWKAQGEVLWPGFVFCPSSFRSFVCSCQYSSKKHLLNCWKGVDETLHRGSCKGAVPQLFNTELWFQRQQKWKKNEKQFFFVQSRKLQTLDMYVLAWYRKNLPKLFKSCPLGQIWPTTISQIFYID